MNPAAGCNIKRSIRAGMAKRCKKCGNSLPQDDAELATVSNKRGKAFRIGLCWWYYEDSTKEERIEYSEIVDVHKEKGALVQHRDFLENMIYAEGWEICHYENPIPTRGFINTCEKCSTLHPIRKPARWHCHYNLHCKFS